MNFIIYFSIGLILSANIWASPPQVQPTPKPSSLSPAEIQLNQEVSKLVNQMQVWQKQFELDPEKNRFLSHCQELEKNQKINSKEYKACKKFYENLFSDGKLEINLFFGYRDTRPSNYVLDLVEKNSLVKTLTATCPRPQNYIETCGFRRDKDDADKLIKSVKGPDGNPKEVIFRLNNSSISLNDDYNRKSDYQKSRTEKMKELFKDALENSDVVYYFGHSRNGGGPDFGPAQKLTAENHVDYDWYKQTKMGKKLMLEALKNRDPNKTLLLGMFSCSSELHFSNSFAAAGAKNTIFSTKTMYDGELIPGIMNSVNFIMNLSCDKSLGVTQLPFHAKVFN